MPPQLLRSWGHKKTPNVPSTVILFHCFRSAIKPDLRARVGRPQTCSSPPVIFIAGRPQGALLFWFFGDFRCGALLFMAIQVIHMYINIKIGKNSC